MVSIRVRVRVRVTCLVMCPGFVSTTGYNMISSALSNVLTESHKKVAHPDQLLLCINVVIMYQCTGKRRRILLDGMLVEYRASACSSEKKQLQ
jgi:hypothetical protein